MEPITIAGVVIATKVIETAVEKLAESGVELTIDGIKKIFSKNGKEIDDKDAERIVHHYQQHNTQILGDSIGTKSDTTTTVKGNNSIFNGGKFNFGGNINSLTINEASTSENNPKKS